MTTAETLNHALQRPAIASLLRSTRPASRVGELASLAELMRPFHHCLLIALSALAWGLPSMAQDSMGQPILIEGSWTHHGVRDIIGRGADTTLLVKREANHWAVAFDQIIYPSVNEKDAKPVLRREGPYDASVSDQELVFTKDGREVRYTFLCDSNRMILPAFVQKKPGLWVFRADRESLQVQCDQDPLKIPVGKAGIPGVLGGKGFYSYEEAPRSSIWPSAQYLRFLEKSDERGQLFERFRLVFDDYGSPRYEAILQTGERSTSAYQLRVFFAANKREP